MQFGMDEENLALHPVKSWKRWLGISFRRGSLSAAVKSACGGTTAWGLPVILNRPARSLIWQPQT